MAIHLFILFASLAASAVLSNEIDSSDDPAMIQVSHELDGMAKDVDAKTNETKGAFTESCVFFKEGVAVDCLDDVGAYFTSSATMDLKASCCTGGYYNEGLEGRIVNKLGCDELGLGFVRKGRDRIGLPTYAELMCSASLIPANRGWSKKGSIKMGWGPNCGGAQVFASCSQLLGTYYRNPAKVKPYNQRPKVVQALQAPADPGDWKKVCDNCRHGPAHESYAAQEGYKFFTKCLQECNEKKNSNWNNIGGCKAVGYKKNNCWLLYKGPATPDVIHDEKDGYSIFMRA